MDEIRSVPRSIEAEQAVLGSMLVDARCIPDVITSGLRAEDFYGDQNRLLFETIYSMFTNGGVIDPITVLGQLQVTGNYDPAVSRSFVGQLVEITPTAANVLAYAEIVKERALLRRLGDAASEISGMVASGEGEAGDVLDSAEQKIYKIRQGSAETGVKPVSVLMADTYRYLDEMAASKGRLPGLTTGVEPLDRMIGGMINSNLILIASRPGMGKTSIALNIALNAARASGKCVAFFSLEMSLQQLGLRLLSSEAVVDSNTLLGGTLSDEEWAAVANASIAISKTKMMFSDAAAVKVSDILAQCRRIDGLGLVVIDYLQLLQGSRKTENRVQEVGDISRSLKIMAKDLNVPVLCCAQLSRGGDAQGGKRPQLSHLRESGSIEQDADVVMLLYRDDYYNEDSEERGIAECIVAKNRHGGTGTIKLSWMGQFTSFSALDTIHGHEA
ncbi:MAG: replicative DNA helicase [Oscillospiraceae bacterium]|nr:replicative DNA helicase [Oscillospiraceae bacterium]